MSGEPAIRTACAYGLLRPPETTSHDAWLEFYKRTHYLEFWGDVGHLSEDNNREWMLYVVAVLEYHEMKKFYHNQIRANSLFFHTQRVTPYQLFNWFNRYMKHGKPTHPIFNAGAQPFTPYMVYSLQRSDVSRFVSATELTRASTFNQSPMAEFYYHQLEAMLGLTGDALNEVLIQLPNDEFLRQLLLSVGVTVDPSVIAGMVSISHYGRKLPVKVVSTNDPLARGRVSVEFAVPIEEVYPLNDNQYYEGWFVLEPKDDIPF